MNLADAIRSAAGAGRTPATPPVMPTAAAERVSNPNEPAAPAPATVEQTTPAAQSPNALAPETPFAAAPADDLDQVVQLPEHSISAQGNMVKLELVLTPEQMNGILRSLIEGHRSILTSREAVAYLRLPQARLEEMAERGELPAFKLGGRWRFPKPALDEWLMAQTYNHGDHHDVA